MVLKTKRVYKKQPKKVTSKTVKDIVTKTIAQKVETKDFTDGLLHNGYSGPRSTLMLYGLGQGTSDHTRLGDDINIKGISVRWQAIGQTMGNSQTVRILIFKSKVQSTGNLTSLAYNQMYKSGGTASGSPNLDRVDTEQITLLNSKIVKITPQFATNKVDICGRHYVPMGKYGMKFKYDGDNSGYGKFFGLHLAVITDYPTVADENTGLNIRVNYTVYYKDA